MAANNDTAYFKAEYERLKKTPKSEPETVEKHILEIQEILKGLAKGLKILEGMGRPPEKKVSENYQQFKDLLDSFSKLSS